MANNLDLSATLALIDNISGPLRSIQSQVGRATSSFNEARKAVRSLERTQGQLNGFQNMQRQLTETSSRLDMARQRMESLRKQIQSTSSPAQTLVNRFNAASRAVEKLDKSVNSQNQALSEHRTRLRSSGIDTDNLGDEQRRLADSIKQANRQLDAQRQSLSKVRSAQQMSKSMGDMRNKSTGLAMGGAAATYGAARLIQPGLDFEQANSKLQAVTRLDKGSEQLQALKAQAEQLGATTQFTQADAARGQTFLGMAGFTPASIKAAMPGMLDLALAGGMELPQTADIASNILSGMKLDPSEMTHVADVLSGAFTRANLDVAMLGETMKYAAPGAADLGISLEEVAAMAGKLGDAGMQGSMGGTALRSIMSRMAAPPKAAADAMDKLGLATTDANGDLLPMIDILEQLDAKTKDMGNTERAGIFKDIAGEEAGGALNVLVDQANSGELQKLRDTLNNVDGEASRLATTMSDNTIGSFKSMMSATDALRTSIFETNKDAIRGFIDGITALAQKMTTWAQAHPELVALLGKVFGILAIGAVVLGSIGAVMLTVLGPMALLRASLVTLGLPGTLTPLGMLVKGIKMIGTAIRIVGAVMMANPLLALIGLLAILAFTIYQNWDTLGPMFANLWASISAGASQLWQWLVSIWNNIKTSLINYANQLWAGLGITFDGGIQSLIGIILAFSPIGLFIRVFAAVWEWLSGLGAKFREYGANMLQGLADGIMSKANAVVAKVSNVVARIKGAFTGVQGMDIHSPSRVTTKYGDHMMTGLDNGILGNDGPIKSMLRTSDSLRSAMDTSDLRFDNRKPIQASNDSIYGSSGNKAPAPITINVYAQPHQSEQQIAELVATALERQQLGQNQNNTALYDLAEGW